MILPGLSIVRAVVTDRFMPGAGHKEAPCPPLQGDDMDFYEMYDEYYDRIKRFLYSLVKDPWVADDLVQETFIKVRLKRDQLKDPEKLTGWIFRIACNLAHDYFKRQNKQKKEEQASEPTAFDIPLMKQLEQKQMADCVQEKFLLIPETSRIILTLFDVMEFSHREIAEILFISEANAKVRLFRARKQFKAILEKHCEFVIDERSVLVCEPKFHSCR